MRRFLLFALFILPQIGGCQQLHTKKPTSVITKSRDSEFISCGLKTVEFRNLKVIFSKRIVGNNADSIVCSDWSLNNDRISFVMNTAKLISSETLHGAFDFLPCKYVGKVRINGCYYDFVLNSGSWFSLTAGGNTSYYGCFRKDVSKYFSSQPESIK